ncbi:MAG TPA: DUF5715 family protein [Candidatus Eisenbacteria bacterium]|nr:DUF5715 family protein [Candidatus Eisenbacteria bacterium]
MGIRNAAPLLILALTLLHSTPAAAQPRRSRSASAAVLRGSRGALAGENELADRHHLSRLRDEAELRRFIAAGLLVPVASTDAYELDPTLGEEDPDNAALYAHARPWVRAFLDDVFAEGHRLHGDRYRITSMVRTLAYQRSLRRHNPFAATGRTRDERSSHMTGSTVDIRSTELSPAGIAWLRNRLAELERAGAIRATEERYNGCFHIMVAPDFERRAHPPRRRHK